MATRRLSTKDRIRDLLPKYDIGNKYSDLMLPKASVLVPLLIKNEEIYVLLTVRSLKLRSNTGEVCFPGGKQEPEDVDDVATALREAKEEIGLSPNQVEVLCRLVPVINKDDILVTPVVGIVAETFEAQLNLDEVSEVFVVPLQYFLTPEQHTSNSYNSPTGQVGLLHFFTFTDHEFHKPFTIWGLTAFLSIIVAFLVLGEKPSFKVDFDIDNPLSSMDRFLLAKYATSKL
ncbi:peroxisomal coenzyme A diphosphatase NUDT7 [Callorhinchus milii]|nr:peroxisomal coenzyme A diphosphatase NUDT7 [Callorhinchus milii]|eukprot:gi/632981530/ref/XP_007907644.1/ PREDICTED: peroxisomal coenzyme A diphosphatase NUDT7 [Callorhinchus milii]